MICIIYFAIFAKFRYFAVFGLQARFSASNSLAAHRRIHSGEKLHRVQPVRHAAEPHDRSHTAPSWTSAARRSRATAASPDIPNWASHQTAHRMITGRRLFHQGRRISTTPRWETSPLPTKKLSPPNADLPRSRNENAWDRPPFRGRGNFFFRRGREHCLWCGLCLNFLILVYILAVEPKRSNSALNQLLENQFKIYDYFTK